MILETLICGYLAKQALDYVTSTSPDDTEYFSETTILCVKGQVTGVWLED